LYDTVSNSLNAREKMNFGQFRQAFPNSDPANVLARLALSKANSDALLVMLFLVCRRAVQRLRVRSETPTKVRRLATRVRSIADEIEAFNHRLATDIAEPSLAQFQFLGVLHSSVPEALRVYAHDFETAHLAVLRWHSVHARQRAHLHASVSMLLKMTTGAFHFEDAASLLTSAYETLGKECVVTGDALKTFMVRERHKGNLKRTAGLFLENVHWVTLLSKTSSAMSLQLDLMEVQSSARKHMEVLDAEGSQDRSTSRG
jgi:hypothetical protein